MALFAFVRARIVGLAVLSTIAAPADAQDSTAVIVTPDSLAAWYRDPHTAQTLGSFIPGAGHLYAGETLRGLGLGAAAVFGIASGIVYLNRHECRFVTFDVRDCNTAVSTTDQINGVTQIAVGVAAWVFGAIDAPRAAHRANEKARRGVAIAPFLRDDLVRQPALGVAVQVGW